MDEIYRLIVNAGGGFAGLIAAFTVFYVGRRVERLETAVAERTDRIERALWQLNKTDLLRLAASQHLTPALKEALAEHLTSVNKALDTK